MMGHYAFFSERTTSLAAWSEERSRGSRQSVDSGIDRSIPPRRIDRAWHAGPTPDDVQHAPFIFSVIFRRMHRVLNIDENKN